MPVVVVALQVNSLLLRVIAISEGYGVRFPREFGLLLKQILYLDRWVHRHTHAMHPVEQPRRQSCLFTAHLCTRRYTRILAPTLNWVQDDRVDIGST